MRAWSYCLFEITFWEDVIGFLSDLLMAVLEIYGFVAICNFCYFCASTGDCVFKVSFKLYFCCYYYFGDFP